jgi:hypothetical protein
VIKPRFIVETSALPAGSANVYDCLPNVLYVGSAVARIPWVRDLIIKQDRGRLVQEQE